jgi:hypothetical protein
LFLLLAPRAADAAAMNGDGSKEDANRRLEWATLNLERGVVVSETTKGDGNGNAGRKAPISIVRLFLACMVSGGIQYGWALQLSLLSPYSQVQFMPMSSFVLWCLSVCLSLFIHACLVFSANFFSVA